jgi:hypothetical protein
MKRKSLSFSDMRAFMDCPWSYLERITSKRRPPERIEEIVGEATHDLAAAPVEQRQPILSKYIRDTDPTQRAEVEKLVRERISVADQMSQSASHVGEKINKEKPLSWFDPVSGWQLFAKPDETKFFLTEHGVHVLDIIELKTGYVLKKKHREQLYHFGMVASLALNHQGPIRLVVRLLGSGKSHEFRYYHGATAGSLAKVRAMIEQIEQFLAATEAEADSLVKLARENCTCATHTRARKKAVDRSHAMLAA